ncbi:MAG: DUF4097 family beta strand repeat protein [Streptosporangiales bacterium]|nr:DUF4097 family beta strand repeat protein [Streptosporangiales bacterium]
MGTLATAGAPGQSRLPWGSVRGISLLGLAVTVLVLAGLAGCNGTVVVGGDTQGDEKNYEVGGRIDRLVVRADAGDVKVTGTEGERTPAVTERLHYDTRKPRTTHKVENNTLVLTATCPGGARRCWVDYAITVERSVQVTAETGAGDVVVENTSRPMEATADAGDVRATGLAGPSAVAGSDAGGVLLEFVSPPDQVDATTSAGDVTIRLPGGTSYAVEADTDVGDSTVDVPVDSGSAHRVRARSDVGDVSVLPRG